MKNKTNKKKKTISLLGKHSKDIYRRVNVPYSFKIPPYTTITTLLLLLLLLPSQLCVGVYTQKRIDS